MNAKPVGKLNLDELRHVSNVNINQLLTNPWLDPDTKKEFMRKQKLLQRKPFILQRLAGDIEHEIQHRKEVYGW